MRFLLFIIYVILGFFLLAPNLSAQDIDLIDREKAKFNKLKGENQDRITHQLGNTSDWVAFRKTELNEWSILKKKVEKKWLNFKTSNRIFWVEYNHRADTRSRINFKDGKIIIESAVPTGIRNSHQLALNNISRHLRETLNKYKVKTNGVLGKLMQNKDGKAINEKNFESFLNDEIIPSIKTEKSTYKAGDKLRRRIYKVEIGMVPDHVRIRAEKYLNLVKVNAQRFNLPPHLIMAIIHTESYFNPYAVSRCGALGLMQIIPDKAGREAYHFLYGRNKKLSSKYLYQPAHNIELGATYLYLLKNKHFFEIKDNIKNRYVTICGYNWGPTILKKTILKHNFLSDLNKSEVFNFLRRKTPAETSQYLHKVSERMLMYCPMFL